MSYCERIAAISSLAIVIAKNIPDDGELSLLAASFTQLGDTLGTIATQRALCNELKENESTD